MKKKLFLSALISIALTLFYCYIPDSFTQNRNVVDIAASPEGVVCLVRDNISPSSSEWRLIALDRDGNRLQDRYLGDYDEDLRYRHCIADDQGRVYALAEESDGQTLRQYVRLYDRNLAPIRTLFQTTQKTPDETDEAFLESVDRLRYDPKLRWNAKTLQYLNGDILSVQVVDLRTVDLHIYRPAADEETVYTYRFAQPVYIEEIVADGSGGLYFTDLQSRLYHVASGGDIQAVSLPQRAIPYRLSVGDAGASLYFNDMHGNAFLRYDARAKRSEILWRAGDSLSADVRFSDVRKLHMENGAFLAYAAPAFGAQNKRFAYLQDASGQARRIDLEKDRYETRAFDFDRYSALLCLSLFAVLFYAWHFSRRLLFKTAVFLTALILAVTLSASYIADSVLRAFLDPYVKQRIYITASMLSQEISPADLSAFATDGRAPSASDAQTQKLQALSAKIRGELSRAQEETAKQDINLLDLLYQSLLQKVFYVTLYYTLANEPYVAADFNPQSESNPPNASARYLIGDDAPAFFAAKQHIGATPAAAKYDIRGAFTASFVPIYDEKRQAIGYVEVGMHNEILSAVSSLLRGLASLFLGLTVFVCLLAVLLVVRNALRSLGKLQKGVEEIAAGNLDASVDIRSGDEFETIGDAFNRMAWKTKTHLQEIKDYSAACQRFIPFGLFGFLGRESVLDVRLGDRGSAELCILSVRAVCNEAGGDPFALLNRIFSVMAGEVGRSGGIIENYYGAGLRAIYAGAPDDAVAAALRIIDAVRLDAGLDAQIYAALTRGETAVGIVGDAQRLEATVLSDTVLRLEALEAFGQQYQTQLLLTRRVQEALQQSDRFSLRTLGRLRVFSPAVDDNTVLVDCLDAYPPAEKRARQAAQSSFEAGVSLCAAGAYHEARKAFVDAVRRSGEDALAKAYIFLCDDRLRERQPDATESR